MPWHVPCRLEMELSVQKLRAKMQESEGGGGGAQGGGNSAESEMEKQALKRQVQQMGTRLREIEAETLQVAKMDKERMATLLEL